jgi:hypothetical protein
LIAHDSDPEILSFPPFRFWPEKGEVHLRPDGQLPGRHIEVMEPEPRICRWTVMDGAPAVRAPVNPGCRRHFKPKNPSATEAPALVIEEISHVVAAS